MSTNELVFVLVGVAALSSVTCAATRILGSSPVTTRRAVALSFVCVAAASILGLTPWLAVPLLLASASGYLVALGGDWQ